jgi:hypothetical protein
VLHTATRKLMAYGRSLVLTLPHYAASKMEATGGDIFVVVFDDERMTVTYQKLFKGHLAPRVAIDGRNVDSELMP